MTSRWLAAGGLLGVVVLAGCGPGEGLLKITQQVAGAIPQLVAPQPNALTWGGASDADEESALGLISKLFAMECHHRERADNCPSGVAQTDANKYSLGTIIGLVYHAELGLGQIYLQGENAHESCARGTDGAELNGHQPTYSPAGADRLIVPMDDLLDCVARFENEAETKYTAYSKAEDGEVYAGIIARHSVGSGDAAFSDIFQVYARLAGGKLQTLAYNVANATGSGGMRALLVVNVPASRFLLKYGAGSAADVGLHNEVVLGTGGIDHATGEWVVGNYAFRMNDPSNGVADMAFCMENSSVPTKAADTSVCDDGTLDGFLESTGGAGWDLASTLLELSSADQAALGGFQDLLADGSYLAAGEIPLDLHDGFPTAVEK